MDNQSLSNCNQLEQSDDGEEFSEDQASDATSDSEAPPAQTLTLMSLVEYYLKRAIADLVLAEARIHRVAQQMANISKEVSEAVALTLHAFSTMASTLDAGGQHEAAATVRAVLASHYSANPRKRKRDESGSPGGLE